MRRSRREKRASSLSEEEDSHVLFGRGGGHSVEAVVLSYRRREGEGRREGVVVVCREGGLKVGQDRDYDDCGEE